MRKHVDITLTDNGNELTFRITQMSAVALEDWLIKVALVLARAGFLDSAELDDVDGLTAVADAAKKIFTSSGVTLSHMKNIDYAKDIKPLILDLYTCVQRKSDKAFTQVTETLLDQIVTDPRTLLRLKAEIIKAHLDFLNLGVALGFQLPAAPASRSRAPKISPAS